MTRPEASQITKNRDGRKVGTQAWGIYPKIREVDELLRPNAMATRRVREVHPEVCFWAWSDKQSMKSSKKKPEGKAERRSLAEKWLGPDVLVSARGDRLKKDVADDDILDAIAALWTADRIARGEAKTLPEHPPTDSTGLRMEIVY